MKSLYKTITALILLLGIVHVAATSFFYSNFDINTVWFISGGLVLILIASINFMNLTTSGNTTSKCTCNFSNLVGLVYSILIVSCLAEPQAMITLILLLCETIIAFIFKT